MRHVLAPNSNRLKSSHERLNVSSGSSSDEIYILSPAEERARSNEHVRRSRMKKRKQIESMKRRYVENEKRIQELEEKLETLTHELETPPKNLYTKPKSSQPRKIDFYNEELRPSWFGDAF